MQAAGLDGDRPVVYKALEAATRELQAAHDALDENASAAVQARHCVEVINPAMSKVREEESI